MQSIRWMALPVVFLYSGSILFWDLTTTDTSAYLSCPSTGMAGTGCGESYVPPWQWGTTRTIQRETQASLLSAQPEVDPCCGSPRYGSLLAGNWMSGRGLVVGSGGLEEDWVGAWVHGGMLLTGGLWLEAISCSVAMQHRRRYSKL